MIVFWILFIFISGCSKEDSNLASNATNPAPAPTATTTEVPYPPVPASTNGSATLNSNKNLAFLQQRFSSAVMKPAPWAGYWWPYSTNGVASAAVKYDAVTSGDAASWERERHGLGLGAVEDWWGHCNGWAAAAMLVPEPRASIEIGDVRFEVRDRKALLSETFMEVTGDFLGTRVDDPSDFSSAAFNDITPAQFYLMFTMVMGAQKRTFVLDRFTGVEVWNQPAVAYSMAPIRPEDYLGPDPQFSNIHRVNVATKIWWTEDNVDPNTISVEFDPANPAAIYKSRTLRYELWLDAAPVFDSAGNLTSSGNIVITQQGRRSVGGVWKNSSLSAENSHPDYMWIPNGHAAASGFKNPNLSDNWVLSNMK